MTADQRLQAILTALAILAGLITAAAGLGLRALWKLAQTLQEDRDATAANTRAIDRLTGRMDALERARRRGA